MIPELDDFCHFFVFEFVQRSSHQETALMPDSDDGDSNDDGYIWIHGYKYIH